MIRRNYPVMKLGIRKTKVLNYGKHLGTNPHFNGDDELPSKGILNPHLDNFYFFSH